MTMLNLDAPIESATLMAQFVATMNDESKTNEEIASAFMAVMEAKVTEYREEMNLVREDASILAGRGVRQLTSAEKKYFAAVGDRMLKGALDFSDLPMPKTVFESVFEDLRTETDSLLAELDLVDTTGLTEFVMRSGDVEAAWWGPLCDEIKKELEMAFKKVKVNQLKLSAYLPVCKSMLALGPEWLDRFVREMLREAAKLGLIKGFVTGTGKDEPIGADRNLAGSVVNGVYPKKTAVKIEYFSPTGMAPIMTKLSNNGKRAVGNLIMIVNPVDYYNIVMPAVLRFIGGEYRIVTPYPFKIFPIGDVTDSQRAVFGIGKKYFLGVGSNEQIEYSNEYRFLEDERVYLTKILANGMPKDNDAFLVLDISELKPMVLQVELTNAEDIPVA